LLRVADVAVNVLSSSTIESAVPPHALSGFGLDTTELGDQIGALLAQDPEGGTASLRESLDTLPEADRARLAQSLVDTLDEDAISALQATPEGRAALAGTLRSAADEGGGADPRAAADLSAEKRELLLDLTQIGLGVAGVFDPTPISDGASLAISVARGDWFGAVIDGVSMIPYAGDLAKIGKLGQFADTVDSAVDLARGDAAFAETLRPALGGLDEALKAVPIDELPAAVSEPLESMRGRLDEFFDTTADGSRALDGLRLEAGAAGDNVFRWELNADGRPVHAEAELSEVFDKAPRSSAETRAQGDVADLGRSDDAGGHVFGHRFTLDQGERNMFPQNAKFNNSAYRVLENEWAAWADSGKRVDIEIDFKDFDGVRPQSLDVSYEVVDPANGDVVYDNYVRFENEAEQQFERVSTSDINENY